MKRKSPKTTPLVTAISMLIRGYEEQQKAKIISIEIKSENGRLYFETILEYDDEER